MKRLTSKAKCIWISWVIILAAIFTCAPKTRAEETLQLTLDEALAMARQANPEILRARADIEAAKARLLQARAWPDPEITLEWSKMPGLLSLARADEFKIGMSQAFEYPGKRKARTEMARIGVKLADAQMQKVEAAVAARVKRSCYAVMFAQKKKESAETMLELMGQFKEVATGRYAAQSGSYLDVLRSKVELAKAGNELTESKRELAAAGGTLARLLGREAGTRITIRGEFAFRPWTGGEPGLLGERVASSPAIRAAEIAANLAGEAIQLARRSFWPDLTLGLYRQRLHGEAPYNANDFQGAFGVDAWAAEIGCRLPLPWNSRRGEIAEARSLEQRARFEREAQRNRIYQALARAAASAEAAAAVVHSCESSLLRDTEAMLQNGMALFGTGRIDALNLLDIIRVHHQARLEYSRALYQYNLSLADFEAAGTAEEGSNED